LKRDGRYDDLRARIRGPVFPIVIPFTENEDVDYEGLHRYVEFLVNGGARVLLLTVGTSRFNLLTSQEMLHGFYCLRLAPVDSICLPARRC
jgi:4-hydroxy-tetrahydrodipicolinate synthase